MSTTPPTTTPAPIATPPLRISAAVIDAVRLAAAKPFTLPEHRRLLAQLADDLEGVHRAGRVR